MKVGVIGTGVMGQNHARNYADMKGIEEVVLFDVFTEAAEKTAEKLGVTTAPSIDKLLDTAVSYTHLDVYKRQAEEQPIDMNTVIDFANRIMSESEHPHMMRKYAEEHLDWMAKMKAQKEFLESL